MFICLLFLPSCHEGEPYTVYEFMMDTQCSITVYSRADREAVAPVFSTLRSFASSIDRHEEGSDVWRINENAGIQPVEVSEPVFDLIARAKELSLSVGGAFNPLMGALSDLWDFQSPDPRIPTEEEVSDLLEPVDIDALVLDEDAHTVYLADSRLVLDLGGIGKGAAGMLASQELSKLGVERAIINLGGNVCCLGSRPDGSPWRVGLQTPHPGSSGYFTTVSCQDASVVTSGSYQRYFEIDGVRYHHILDPATGWPARSGLVSVSVISPDGALADAYATAFFVLGLDASMEICRRDGLQAIFMTGEGEVVSSY